MAKDSVVIMGLDAGFRKLGVAVFTSHSEYDDLIVAKTETNAPDKDKDKYVMQKDVAGCWQIGFKLDEQIGEYKPDAVFVELPHGGGQGARAHRCMGLITGVIVTVLRHSGIYFKLYAPRTVEELLGIIAVKKACYKSKGELRADKKKRMQDHVISCFPEFKGWPKQVALFEDAADAVAVVLAARAEGECKLVWTRGSGS